MRPFVVELGKVQIGGAKMVKRVLKIIAIGVCLGLLLLFVQRSLQIGLDTFLRAYWIAAPALVIGAVLVNALYNLSYQRKMQALVGLLKAGKPQEYIREVEKLLQTAKGQSLRTVLRLNLAAGYMEARDFDTAVPMLEELPDKRLNTTGVRLVHRVNLCQCYFETAQPDKAMAVYRDSQSLFQQYENDKTYGGNIAVLNILAALQSGDREQAERLLDAARNTWSDPRFQTAAQKIEDVLAQQSPGERQ